ncbi:MAG TPA: alpha/beta hydrolase-fold protein [Minicystis sp.]|nr:alpha/beta hydrolase-fold protein [Minicystis sp.]
MRPGVVGRRSALAALGALALAACKKKAPAPSGPWVGPESEAKLDAGRTGTWRELAFDPSADAPEGERATLHTPENAAALPLLVALHGRGESGNGLQIGARAWPEEYELARLDRRLAAPPLVAADALDLETPERLAKINAALAANPYESMTIACPYAPYQAAAGSSEVLPFSRFLVDVLLPRARAKSGCRAPRERTGIDGVSMGGRIALLVGLSRPDVFGVVGALQPAVKADEAEMWSKMAQAAMKERPLKLRLLTSEQDVFREPVEAIAKRLEADGVPHELLIVPGEHGYTFNRGPGSLEMLLWHDRASRGLPPV